MPLVLGFLPLLEVTTLIKTTVTGRHMLLQQLTSTLLLHIHLQYWFLFALQGLFLLVFTEQRHQRCGRLRHFFHTGLHDL